jgi:hypothetical protein
MASDASAATAFRPSGWDFNKELLCGEAGALLVANGAAAAVARFTPRAALISLAAVAGTLSGGSVFWLATRIFDRTRAQSFAAREMAQDLSYFTPAAVTLGLAVYQPAMYATAHYLLQHGVAVAWSVTSGQGIGFGLFMVAMNLYRFSLLKISGKRL